MRDGIITDERPNKTADLGALTLDEFCRCYRVGRTTAYEEINAGRLTARKRGSRTLIAREEALRWFRSLPPFVQPPIPMGS